MSFEDQHSTNEIGKKGSKFNRLFWFWPESPISVNKGLWFLLCNQGISIRIPVDPP